MWNQVTKGAHQAILQPHTPGGTRMRMQASRWISNYSCFSEASGQGRFFTIRLCYGFFFHLFFLAPFVFFFFFLLQEHSLSWGRNETLIFLLTGLCTTGNYQRNRCIIDVVGKQEGDFRPKMSPLSWSSLWGWWPHSFHLGTGPVLLNSYSTSLFFKHSQTELFRWTSLRVRCLVMHSLPAEGPPGPVPYLLWAMPGWCSCDQKHLEGCGRRWLSW